MQQYSLEDVNGALERGDKATARSMIDAILTAQPTAEGWVLAARSMETPADQVKCLIQALTLEPASVSALTMLNSEPGLAELYQQAMGSPAPLPPVTTQPSGEAVNPLAGLGIPGLGGREAQTYNQIRGVARLFGVNLPDAKGLGNVIGSAANQAGGRQSSRREGDANVYEEGVYEMLWDCRFCGTTKLLGKTHAFCPVCGAMQDPDWRYYPSDEEKVAVKDHVFVGADKTCPNCGSLNAANVEFCKRCGAPQSEASAVKAQAARQAMQGDKFLLEDLDARQLAHAKTFGLPVKPTSKGMPKWAYLIIALVIGAIGFGATALFWKQTDTAYVTGFSWSREIAIEQYSAVPQSSICSSMPMGAYGVSRRTEVVGQRQVPDGESCTSRQVDQGDGTFRQEQVCTTRYRSEPVYGEVCYYTVNLWQQSRTASAKGDKSVELNWPATNIRCSTTTLGCEREGRRAEEYLLQLKAGEDKEYTCPVALDVWQETAIESTFDLQVRVIGGSPDCSTLKPH